MSDTNNLISVIQNSQRTLFILCGFPYAGKSFLAEQVLEQTDTTLVSIDTIFHSHGFDWNSNRLPDAHAWERIFAEANEQARQSLMRGKNVLYDSTNQTIASRSTLREIAHAVHADTKVIFVTSPIGTVWERWEENQRNPRRPVVRKDLVQMTIDMFEEPIEEENVIVIQN